MTLKLIIPGLLLAAGFVVAAPAAHAADAKKPYSNVDKRVDAGNDTGDSQVDKLNDMQLNKNYKGPIYYQGQAPVTQTAPVMPPK